MIRVLHVGRAINRGDFVDTVLRGLDRAHFAPSAATFSPRANIADPRFAEANIPQLILDVETRRDFVGGARRLAQHIQKERIDIVHAHHFESMQLAVLARALTPFRLVFGRHYSDAIPRIKQPWKRAGYRLLERTLNTVADAIVAPSQMVRRLLLESGVPERKILVIPYSFDAQKLQAVAPADVERARAELAAPGRVTIATFGRFHPEKGHLDLIDAAATLAQTTRAFRLYLVGDGDARADYEARIAARGLGDEVRILGWRTDVPALMSAIDVVVQPSYSECFSQVMLEALVLGRPLVMTRVSGVEDAITDGRSGLIVPIADVPAIASALHRVVTSPELRRSLGDAAQQVALARYASAKILPLFESGYRSIMESR